MPGVTLDIKNHAVRFFTDGSQVGQRALPSLGASVARGQFAALCGPANGNSGMLGELRYLAVIPSPMDSDEHREFYNAFAQELKGSGIHGSAAPMPILPPVIEFDTALPERLAQQFIFLPDFKGGLVESAVSENRRVLRFHGEIAAGLDLDHQIRIPGHKLSLRFRFKHLR